MPLTLEQLAAEAMHLSFEARAKLLDDLVESFDLAKDLESRALWAKEAIRRRDEVRTGLVQPVPGEEVIVEIRRMVG